MSRRHEQALSGEPESTVNRSVFDFLYQDARRVGSLLAQFDPNGVLQSLTRTEGFGESSDSSAETEATINVLAAKGNYKTTEKNGESFSAGASRAYDALWSNSLTLLDYLNQHQLIVRDLSKARLGQVVLISGRLSVYDIPMLRNLFSDMDLLRKAIQGVGGKQNAQDWAGTKSAFKLFTSLPLSVQAVLEAESRKVWTILESDNLQTSATNLFLKYGTSISGTWHMAGILDALPDDPNIVKITVEHPEKDAENVMEVMSKLEGLTTKLGRPKHSYGVTPLLIFREVEGPESPE